MAHIVQLTEVADLFYHDPSRKSLTKILTLERNEIQHGLLSFPTSQFDAAAFAVDEKCLSGWNRVLALIELIRLAASVYSDMVLFPLPWRTGVKPRLAARMRLILESSQLYRLAGYTQTAHTELHIWLLWFGCFAAFRSRHQEWFEHELCRVLGVFYRLQWGSVAFDTVKRSLHGFLWWDPVCHGPGQDLWSRLKSHARVDSTNLYDDSPRALL